MECSSESAYVSGGVSAGHISAYISLAEEMSEEFVSAGPPGEVPAGHSLYLPEPEPGSSGADEARYRLQLAVGARTGSENSTSTTPVATAHIPAGNSSR